jgi:membrane protein
MKITPGQQQAGHSSLKTWADKQTANPWLLPAAVRYLVRLILITAQEFKHNELSLRSAALTYTVLLSLVPVLAISTAVVKGLGGGDQLRKAASTYIETLEEKKSAPHQEELNETSPAEPISPTTEENLTGHLRSAVDKLFDYVDKTNFATLGTIGIVGILYTVIMVLSSIEEAMNAIWKVTAGRSLLRKIADYIALLILMPISINVAFAASAFLKNPALASKMNMLIPFPWLQVLLLKAVPVLIIALTFYVMYIFFPNTKVKTFPALFGSILAAILWFAVQNIYIALQIGVSNYNAIYGSFATFPLFLVWIYLGWMFFLTGAQVAFAFQNVKAYRLVPLTAASSLKLAAAFDIMDSVYRAFTAGQSVTAETLAANLPPYSPPLIAESLAILKAADVIHTSQSDERLLPTSPSEQYDGKAVVEIILGTEAPDTDGGTKSIMAIEAAAEAMSKPEPPIGEGERSIQAEQTDSENANTDAVLP